VHRYVTDSRDDLAGGDPGAAGDVLSAENISAFYGASVRVVQEDGRTSSFGATVIAELTGADDDFYSLLAPPRLVAKDDVHIPFHPDLERAVLPSVDDVVAAVRSVLI